MIAKIYDNNIWDKQRVIDACLEICDEKWRLPVAKNYYSDSYRLRIARLKAVLQSQNIDYKDLTIGFTPKTEINDCNFYYHLEECSGIVNLVSPTTSDTTLSDLKHLFDDHTYNLHVSKLNLTHYHSRCVLFDGIFAYRMFLKKISPFRTTCESCKFMYNFSKEVYENHFKDGVEYIDQALQLLMGDNFANPITVEELITKYGYPKISDGELQDIDIENY